MKGRLGREYFEGLYAESRDPWNFETSEYERNKYRRTLEVLGERHFERALEAGASIGVFTEMLAGRCDELIAVDVSERAVAAARNEEALVGANLSALAMQSNVPPEQYEVLLVLDRCTDGTGERAMEVACAHPSLRLHLQEGPGLGSGHARRAGMEAACERLTGLGRPGGLIASTDADTVVARDWLSAQLAATARGARAIGGRIELDVGSIPQAVVRWQAKRGQIRYQRVLSDPDRLGTAEHWQFSGASLSLTAETYAQVGGLEPGRRSKTNASKGSSANSTSP